MEAVLNDRKIAVLATDGFEQSELEEPVKALREAGAKVEVVSLHEGEIRGWKKTDWGTAVSVDKTLDDVMVGDYDGLVVPGGQTKAKCPPRFRSSRAPKHEFELKSGRHNQSTQPF